MDLYRPSQLIYQAIHCNCPSRKEDQLFGNSKTIVEQVVKRICEEIQRRSSIERGTISSDFFGFLSRRPPSSLTELMQRAEKYIRQDDALITNRFAREDREGEENKRWDEKRKDVRERRANRRHKFSGKHKCDG